MTKGTMPFNAETLDAIVKALTALTFATVRQLPPARRQAFANDLATMARFEERAGNTSAETLLLDLYGAANEAASP